MFLAVSGVQCMLSVVVLNCVFSNLGMKELCDLIKSLSCERLCCRYGGSEVL